VKHTFAEVPPGGVQTFDGHSQIHHPKRPFHRPK
jgi:hypothetical protein